MDYTIQLESITTSILDLQATILLVGVFFIFIFTIYVFKR